MFMIRPSFGIALLLGLPLSHAVVYFSLLRFFNITGINTRLAIIAALAFLTISFVTAYVIGRIKDNAATRVFFISASLWLGILTNFVMAYTIGWLASLTTAQANLGISNASIGLTATAFALVYTSYGVYNALHPRVKRVTVHVSNLPKQWHGKRVVQASDLHLGRVWGLNSLRRIIGLINFEKPEVIFITGDLFDGQCVALEPFTESLNALDAPKGVLFVSGNHDTYLGVKRIYDYLEKTKVKPLKNELIDIDGLQVIGLSYPSAKDEWDVKVALERLKGFDADKPSIVLYHKPIAVDAIKSHGVSMQLSGHTHKGQFRPFGFLIKILYGPYDYGLKEDDGFAIYTTSGLGSWGPMLRTGNHPELVLITLQGNF